MRARGPSKGAAGGFRVELVQDLEALEVALRRVKGDVVPILTEIRGM